MSTIYSLLNLHDSWYHSMRIISKHLLAPNAALLFGPIAATPQVISIPFYKKVKEQVLLRAKNKAEKGEPEYNLKVMNETWPDIFSWKLLEFFQTRLLGTSRDKEPYIKRSMDYCNLILDIVGEENRQNNFRIITGQFFLMMKTYICQHLPGKPMDAENMDFLDILRECRTRYMLANPNDKFYVDFEKNTYSSGILSLMDELADNNSWIENPVCDYFILASEYFNALAIYVYMIEFCIYTGNCRKRQKYETENKDIPKEKRPKEPCYVPCFLDDIGKYRFNLGREKTATEQPEQAAIESEEKLPSNIRVYLKDETTGKCYALPLHGEWVAGRKANKKVDIPFETDDNCISRQHAVFTLKKNVLREFELTVRDYKETTNPTYVGYTALSHKFAMQIFDGDKMLLGKTIFSVHIR